MGAATNRRNQGLHGRFHEPQARLEQFLFELDGDGIDHSREIQNVLAYIHSNLFEPSLSVSALRRELGLRDHNLSTRFRQHVGLGIREYIETLRIRAAQPLLEGELQVYRVAQLVGYTHHESFCRAFRRVVGRAPSERIDHDSDNSDVPK